MRVPRGPLPAPRDPKHWCQCAPHFTPGWVLGSQPVWCWGWAPQRREMVLGLPRDLERGKAWGAEGEGLSAAGLCRSGSLMQLPPPWHLRGVPRCPPHGQHLPPATYLPPYPCHPHHPHHPCHPHHARLRFNLETVNRAGFGGLKKKDTSHLLK